MTKAKYLLIESRDPFETRTTDDTLQLAEGLVAEGHVVTLFLVQNGVLPARPGTASRRLSEAARKGVEILADDFSLKERGIALDRLADGIKAAPLDVVVDQLAEGRKALWH